MLETQVWSLGREDPLDKGMTTHSSTHAWRIPGTEDEPSGLWSVGLQRVGQDSETFTLETFQGEKKKKEKDDQEQNEVQTE